MHIHRQFKTAGQKLHIQVNIPVTEPRYFYNSIQSVTSPYILSWLTIFQFPCHAMQYVEIILSYFFAIYITIVYLQAEKLMDLYKEQQYILFGGLKLIIVLS
jgi:hypothetical protein